MAHPSSQGTVFQTGNALTNSRIIDASGQPASLISIEQRGDDNLACVQTGDGLQVLVPTSVLELQEDGAYRLPFAFDGKGTGQVRLPVIEEALEVGKRIVTTGAGVRIRKTVAERAQTVDEPLMQETLNVERVPVDILLTEAELPDARYEGDTLIVPVLEEVLVVQKQFRLKEEVRITRQRREVRLPQTVSLRSEKIDVERFDDDIRPVGSAPGTDHA